MAGEPQHQPGSNSITQLQAQLAESKQARQKDEAAAREEIEWLNEQLQILEEAYTRADAEKRSTISRTQAEMEDMSKDLAVLASQLSEEDRLSNAEGMQESKRILDFIMNELRALRLELEQSSANRSEAMSAAKGKQMVLQEAKSDLEYLSSETKEIVRQLAQVRKERDEFSVREGVTKEVIGGYLKEADEQIVAMQMEGETNKDLSQMATAQLQSEVDSLRKQLDVCKSNSGDEAMKQCLDLKEAEIQQLWKDRQEDRQRMDSHLEDLQHALVQLKGQNAEYQMENVHDKQVTEKILGDLELRFKTMLQEGEDKLVEVHAQKDARIKQLEAQLETSRQREVEANTSIAQLQQKLAVLDSSS